MTDEDSLTRQLLIRLRVLVRLKRGDRDPNTDEVERTLHEIIMALRRMEHGDKAPELLGREHLDETIAALTEQEHRKEAIGEVMDKAVSAIYVLYVSEFYWYGRRRGLPHQDAEDVVQQTFERVFCRIETFNENRSSGEAWMWKVFRSRLADFFRRIHPDIPIEPDEDIRGEEEISDDDEDLERRHLDKEQFEALKLAISHLPKEDLSVIRSPGTRGPASKKYKMAVVRLKILYHMFYDHWIVDDRDMDDHRWDMNDRERHLFQVLCRAWNQRDFSQEYQRVIRRVVLSCEPASPQWHEAAGRLRTLFFQEYDQGV